MPLHWKIINIFVIVIPKFMLWSLTAQSGITFLMETSAIDDMVVNSVALAFILQIDELLCSELMSETSKQILEMLEDYELSGFEEANAVERMREDELLQESISRTWRASGHGGRWRLLSPTSSSWSLCSPSALSSCTTAYTACAARMGDMSPETCTFR
ncbi:unnamed protein product [Effrenium voratum]|nr:unnamed protein product [Effrenium voratum]